MTIKKILILGILYLIANISYAHIGATLEIGKFSNVSGMKNTAFKGNIHFKENNSVFFIEHISIIENRHDKGINSVNYKYLFNYKEFQPYIGIGIRDITIDDDLYYGNDFSTILTRIGVNYKFINIEILDRKPFIGLYYSF